MKKLLLLAAVLLAVPFISAMGTMPETTVSESIPNPEKNIEAVFLDQMDVATECSHISIEGKVYLDGTRGKGAYVLPLENVDTVSFYLKEGVLTAQVRMKESGEKISLTVNPDRRAFGKTRWGTFQIKLGDLKSITITGSSRASSVPSKR
ncbi:MAG TPA: hypothetical protein ENN35_08870 [Deltaproteobacteria bacterium]|nr:hypothetical protein [Deltaproteobacteria bacterium]